MKIIKSILILTFFILITYNSYATVYYVSNSGNDSNNGISPESPLKSVLKINQIISKMIPGDVILLERGSIFYGQINISSSGDENSPIIIAAYGEGKNPVISASVPITEWSIYEGNIYSSNVNGIVKNLFSNGKQMTLARYPNSGFLSVDNHLSDPKKGFTDNELKQPSGYWNGSIARIRTINWAYEYSEIENFKNSTIVLKTPPYYPVQSGWGYYLDNNLNELDTFSEWYFSKNENDNGTLYFYPPDISDINTMNIEGSIYDYGIFSSKEIRNIIILDLEVRNQSVTGINFFNNVSEVRIENCTFNGQFQTGVSFVKQAENISINNCRFYNVNGRGLSLLNVNNSSISRNIFLNSGMIPGYGTTGDPFVMSAAFVFGNSNQISGNYIDGVGHDAINCLGTGNIVEKNVIKNCLQLLNDGGGIKCYGDYSKNSVWKNNFIFGVKGNYENTIGGGSVALGIYLDEFANNMSILNNTITGSGFSGIGVHNGFNNLIQNNICYNNRVGINFFQNLQSINNRIIDNVIKGNSDNQYFVDIKYLGGNLLPGRFDSNYYFNPGNYRSFSITYNNIASDYSFDKWKSFIRSDDHSNIFVGPEVIFSKLFTNMSDENLTIGLNTGYNYRDIDMNHVSGSITLQPWTSEILISDSDMRELPEITIAGGPLNFGDSGEENASVINWYNISGINLKDPVIITAPESIEISLYNDHDFKKMVTLNHENGKVDKIIFVKIDTYTGEDFYDIISNKSGFLVSNVKVIRNKK